jgi:hypothetical protein
MPPQGRDSEVSNPLSGVSLWAQLTVPDHAEFALADGYDLGGAAIVDQSQVHVLSALLARSACTVAGSIIGRSGAAGANIEIDAHCMQARLQVRA